MSGCLCLTLSPQLAGSSSLLFSWTAALIVLLPLATPWLKAACFYIALFPLLLPFHTMHPFVAASQSLFAPLLASFLIPIGFVAALIPPLQLLADIPWRWFLDTLQKLSPYFSTTPHQYIGTSLILQWCYIIGLHWHALYSEQRDLISFRQRQAL